jgi:hypothetical protein
MKGNKHLYYFFAAISLLHIWDILFYPYNIISGNISTFLNFLSVAVGMYFLYPILNDKIFENSYFKFMLILFCLYNLTVIGRGIPTNYAEIKENLQSEFIFWPFVIPLIVLVQKELATLAQVFKLMYFLGIFFLIVAIVFPSVIFKRETAEIFIPSFSFGCAFLLMNTKYLSAKKTIVPALAMIISISAFIYLARRSSIASFTGLSIAAILLYIKEVVPARLIRLFGVLCVFFILIVSFIDYLPSSFTKKLTDRAKEDTRTALYDVFFREMRDDLILGKGMNGSYRFIQRDNILDDGTMVIASEYRKVIENGYLQFILTGGYVEVLLFVLILLPAAYLGIFKSSNNLGRSCGFLIALWLIDMLLFGLPGLNFRYIFIWVSVGLCYKKTFRQLPEDEIYQAFQNVGLA